MQVLTGFGGDAEAVEALVCKTGLSGFESHRYLHCFVNCFLLPLLPFASELPRFPRIFVTFRPITSRAGRFNWIVSRSLTSQIGRYG